MQDFFISCGIMFVFMLYCVKSRDDEWYWRWKIM